MRIIGDYDKPNTKQTSNVQRGELFERAAKRNLKKFHALIPCTNRKLFEHAAKRSLKKFHAFIPCTDVELFEHAFFNFSRSIDSSRYSNTNALFSPKK